MEIFYCNECQKEFGNYVSYRKHMSMKHKIKSEDLFIQIRLNNVKPTCKCGCGETTKFLGDELGFREYKKGHISRIKNNWGHNPSAIDKSHQKQREMHLNGDLVIWNKGLTKETDERVKKYGESISNNVERGKLISEVLLSKNIKRTEEQKQKNREWQIGSWNNIEKREKHSKQRLIWMRDNSKVKTSSLELVFNNILIDLGFIENIDYVRSYLVENIKTFFDFYFIKQNILIETDGDFYHCNPNTKFKEPKYEIQFKNISNDKRKNTWAENHNIQLIRYWENDIKNNTEWVINDLNKKLDIYSKLLT